MNRERGAWERRATTLPETRDVVGACKRGAAASAPMGMLLGPPAGIEGGAPCP